MIYKGRGVRRDVSAEVECKFQKVCPYRTHRKRLYSVSILPKVLVHSKKT